MTFDYAQIGARRAHRESVRPETEGRAARPSGLPVADEGECRRPSRGMRLAPDDRRPTTTDELLAALIVPAPWSSGSCSGE
jgi:hypothetical protein